MYHLKLRNLYIYTSIVNYI